MEKKVCIVTGASGGIGSRIVIAFLEKSYFVVMADINEEGLKKVVEDNHLDSENLMTIRIDISNEEDVKEKVASIAEKLGRIDVLVNAAGICGEYNRVIDYSFDNFRRVYEINVFGTFLMCKYVLMEMAKAKSGSIINFGSVSGMRGYTFEIGYGSSKWAIIGMSENIASEYGNLGIRCNSVSPGWVNTGMMEKTLENYRKLGAEKPECSITLGSIERPCEAKEIADVVCFLAGEEASYVNGANIVVDGGMLVK